MDKSERIMMGVEKPVIKFSHPYVKLDLTQDIAALMRVTKGKFEELHAGFVHNDTLYINPKDNMAQHYPLPKKGDCLLLEFMYGNGERFKTVRRFTPLKAHYYTSLLGREFKVEVKEDE
jgi:hypothetical protein